jgi:hypothetical protein
VEQVCDRVAVIDRGRVIALGTMDELRGVDRSVRLRVTGLDRAGEETLGRYGALQIEGDWYTVRGLDAEQIPAVVADVVALGGRVYAVEPRQHSLEDRFLELLGDADGARTGGLAKRAAHQPDEDSAIASGSRRERDADTGVKADAPPRERDAADVEHRR